MFYLRFRAASWRWGGCEGSPGRAQLISGAGMQQTPHRPRGFGDGQSKCSNTIPTKWYFKCGKALTQGWDCTGFCCSPSWCQVGRWLSHSVGTGWGTTGGPSLCGGQQVLIAKLLSKPSSVIAQKPARLRIRAQPGPAHTHTHSLLPSLGLEPAGHLFVPPATSVAQPAPVPTIPTQS